MSLTATQPDREVIDAITLDAAWKHAEMMKQERDNALRRADESRRNMERAVSVKNGYVAAIFALVDKHGLHRGDHPRVAEIVDELTHIYADLDVV